MSRDMGEMSDHFQGGCLHQAYNLSSTGFQKFRRVLREEMQIILGETVDLVYVTKSFLG